MGDFNMEEEGGRAADRQSARGAMLRSYAAVCARLGSTIAGGLEDAHAIVHGGRPAPTSAAGRSIDRILVDPRMVGGVPGLVGTAHVSQLIRFIHACHARVQVWCVRPIPGTRQRACVLAHCVMENLWLVLVSAAARRGSIIIAIINVLFTYQ